VKRSGEVIPAGEDEGSVRSGCPGYEDTFSPRVRAPPLIILDSQNDMIDVVGGGGVLGDILSTDVNDAAFSGIIGYLQPSTSRRAGSLLHHRSRPTLCKSPEIVAKLSYQCISSRQHPFFQAG
jgi:hypothetical protein